MGVIQKKRVRSWRDKHTEGQKEKESKKQKGKGRHAKRST